MTRLLLTALASLLLLPSVAAAADDTIITFDTLPVNTTQLTTQYQASDGVTFGRAHEFGIAAGQPQCAAGYTVDGIDRASANIQCAGNEFDSMFGTTIEFAFLRRAVRFRLRQGTSGAALDAHVAVYSSARTVLHERTVALGTGITRDVGITRPSSQIAYVVISGWIGARLGGGVLLDDIVAPQDDQPPPPEFALAPGGPAVDVVEGSTAAAPISVRRFNGSTGNIALTIAALPAGIDAAQIDPNPLPGRNPASLRVTAASPMNGDRELTITAAGSPVAGTATVNRVVQVFRGVPAVWIPEGGRTPLRLVPGCGPQTTRTSFNVRGGYTGTAGVIAAAPTGGLTASAVTASVPIAGDGAYPIELMLDPGTGGGSGQFDLEIHPSNATPASSRYAWRSDRLRIDRVEPLSVRRPLPGTPRSTVTLTGNLPPGCAVTFKDGAGQIWPQRSRDSVADGDARADQIVLDLPPTAVSGALQILSPSGAEIGRTAAVDVTDFRNVFALSGANAGAGAGAPDYTWGDFERTFGRDDTDACFVFCVRDPIAVSYYNRFRDKIRSYAGLCAGWSIMALRFRGYGAQQYAQHYQPGMTRPWLISPLTDGTAVKRDIVRWQVAQNDKAYVAQRTSQANVSPADKRRQIRALIDEAGAALLAIYQGTAGHAIVAYGYQDTAAGGLQLSTYDPNIPYTTAEETSSTARASNLTRSTMVIGATGNWIGSSLGWSGANASLRVLSILPSENASLPSTFSLASLANAGTGSPPASVSSIRARGGEALASDGTPRAGTGVTLDAGLSGVLPQPEYALAPGRTYVMTIRGVRGGSYNHGVLGRGAAATVRGAPIKAGQEDRLSVRPGSAGLAFRTGAASAPVTYDLADADGKTTRTAAIHTTARRGGSDAAELAGGAVRLSHEGAPTTMRVTLGSVGAGAPMSVTTGPLPVGRDQRLELRPRTWSALDDGVQLTIRDRRGNVVRRGRARLVATSAVAINGLTARRRGPNVTVTGRVTKRGSAPVLAVTTELVRNRKVLRRRSTTRRGHNVTKGRFSLAIKLGRVPRAARVRITVTLLDEAAQLAGVRRRVDITR